MRQRYQELQQLNEELIGEYIKRANNHEQLLKSLKAVNEMIQRAANLRYGKPKAVCVSACRKALKRSDFRSLAHIITHGRAARS